MYSWYWWTKQRLLASKAGDDCCKASLKITEKDEEETQEVTVNLADANGMKCSRCAGGTLIRTGQHFHSRRRARWLAANVRHSVSLVRLYVIDGLSNHLPPLVSPLQSLSPGSFPDGYVRNIQTRTQSGPIALISFEILNKRRNLLLPWPRNSFWHLGFLKHA